MGRPIITVNRARQIASSGKVVSRFLGEVRQTCDEAEQQKRDNKLDSADYWQVQDLLAFANYYADACFADLGGVHSR
jgi:hypothetical protein